MPPQVFNVVPCDEAVSFADVEAIRGSVPLVIADMADAKKELLDVQVCVLLRANLFQSLSDASSLRPTFPIR